MSIDNVTTNKKPKPIVLLILDGWGLSPSWGGNAIAMNNPPNINKYWRMYRHAVLQAFRPVASEIGMVANSEIGHASIGTGRMVEPDINDINSAIKNKSFFRNSALTSAYQNVVENNSNLHLVGLLSDGAVHSHIKHLFALLEFAKLKKIKNVFIHIITDGRDVPSTSAIKYINDLENKIKEIGVGKVASITGRYYAMDRNKNWRLIEQAYKAQVLGLGRKENNPLEAISHLYRDGFTDEFIVPTVITENNKPVAKIKNNDSVIFFNFRADRIQELARAYLDSNIFKSLLVRKYPLLKIDFVSMTDYKIIFENLKIAFPDAKIESNLAKILSNHNLRQLHIAESEKYAHVTYFFNGGYEKAYSGEDREIVKSPKNTAYDLNPEMSAGIITKKAIAAIDSNKYDFILINYANVDMVGHTGNILAASKAVEVVDKNVAKIVNETLTKNGLVIITADHGNVEQMITLKEDKDPETIHSLNPVPFIMISSSFKKNLFKSAYKSDELLLTDILSSQHTLADIAPTILDLLKIAKPTDMTGHSLVHSLE